MAAMVATYPVLARRFTHDYLRVLASKSGPGELHGCEKNMFISGRPDRP